MAVVDWLVRAVAGAVLVGLIATEAAAAPLVAGTMADAGDRTDAAATFGPVADVCAGDVGVSACDQRGLGELVSAPVTLFDEFAAHAGQAGAAGQFADLRARRPVGWALLTAAMAASGTPARLELASAIRPGAAEAETTLIADVAGIVRQVPEPTAPGLLLTGLALVGMRFRRLRFRH